MEQSQSDEEHFIRAHHVLPLSDPEGQVVGLTWVRSVSGEDPCIFARPGGVVLGGPLFGGGAGHPEVGLSEQQRAREAALLTRYSQAKERARRGGGPRTRDMQDESRVRSTSLPPDLSKALRRLTEVRCSVLLKPSERRLPASVCPPTCLETVGQFALTRVESASDAMQLWAGTWPLPLGEDALNEFAKTQGLWRPELPPADPELPARAEIGLVVRRRVGRGNVTLFCLTERRRDPMGEYGWLFHDRYLPKVTSSMHREVRSQLERWFRTYLLGQEIKARGRLPKSVDPLDDIRKLYDGAIWKSGPRATDYKVAEKMAVSEAALKKYRSKKVLEPLAVAKERIFGR